MKKRDINAKDKKRCKPCGSTYTHTGDFRKSMYKINRDSKFKLVLLIGTG